MRPEDTQTVFEPVHVDRRRLPRVVLRAPARVVTSASEKVIVRVHDVSPDGLQLRCNRATASKLHPAGRSVRPGDPVVHLEVSFAAPTDDGQTVITVLTKIGYVALIAPDLLAIGALIIGASQQDRARLNRFFSYAMRPPEEHADVPPPARPGKKTR